MIELNETILLALINSACTFAGVLMTISLGFANWRVMRRHDLLIDAYANLKIAFAAIDEKLITLKGYKAVQAEKLFTATIKEGYYEQHLNECLKNIDIDKYKTQIFLDDKILPIYDNLHELINDYLYACTMLKINLEKTLLFPEKIKKAENLLSGKDTSYNTKRREYEEQTDNFFNERIKHPYTSYFCSKFRCGKN